MNTKEKIKERIANILLNLGIDIFEDGGIIINRESVINELYKEIKKAERRGYKKGYEQGFLSGYLTGHSIDTDELAIRISNLRKVKS